MADQMTREEAEREIAEAGELMTLMRGVLERTQSDPTKPFSTYDVADIYISALNLAVACAKAARAAGRAEAEAELANRKRYVSGAQVLREHGATAERISASDLHGWGVMRPDGTLEPTYCKYEMMTRDVAKRAGVGYRAVRVRLTTEGVRDE